MRKTSFFSFFLLVLVSAGWTQTSAPAPNETADYSQDAFVTEHYIESFRFENDGTGREQIDARIKINSDSGVQALGQLKVGYSALSDKLEVVYVRVIKPDGTVDNRAGIGDPGRYLPQRPDVYRLSREAHQRAVAASRRCAGVPVRSHDCEPAHSRTILDQLRFQRSRHRARRSNSRSTYRSRARSS